MQSTERPDASAAMRIRCAWRLTALYLQQSLRLYVGPAQWKRFPDSIAFITISTALNVLLYAIQLTLSGHPLSVSWVNLLFPAGMGTIVIMVRHDLPFASAGFGIMLAGLLPSIALEGLRSTMAGHAQPWGAMPDLLNWLDEAWQTWMLVTGLRLCVAKVIDVERPKRDAD